MCEEFDQQLQAAKTWARSLRDSGWLTEEAIQPLLILENHSPASLFEAGSHRPLVAAFFGGTGVGKSTLLNRLAGESVARVGVERPTSREVSIYLHESLKLRQLPTSFPVDRVRVAWHRDETRRQVLWIDMPDIDSTESSNRDLVADWLPHIDVLIYVVSPERYRDDKGWRLLREHVKEHAWLFVMNQWDRGQAAQLDDFIGLLGQGGFVRPMVYCTDCREPGPSRKPDEFPRLEAVLQDFANSHLMEQLERRVIETRQDELGRAIRNCLAGLGADSDWDGLGRQWTQVWEATVPPLLKGLEWPMGEVAKAFVHHEASPFLRSIKLESEEKNAVGRPLATPSLIWDDWAQMQWHDALDRLLVEAGTRRLPVMPLKTRLSGLAETAGNLMVAKAQQGLRLGLANPGNALQRSLLKFSGILAVLLPLASMGWVSWYAFNAYYESALTHLGFLGVDFAMHSLLLVGMSWLLPFFVGQKLKPSNEKAACRGLRQGLEAGLALLHANVLQASTAYAADLQACALAGRGLLSPLAKRQADSSGLLRRMMPQAAPSASVGEQDLAVAE